MGEGIRNLFVEFTFHGSMMKITINSTDFKLVKHFGFGKLIS